MPPVYITVPGLLGLAVIAFYLALAVRLRAHEPEASRLIAEAFAREHARQEVKSSA